MSDNSKWPDFRLASTIWGLVGSNSKDHDARETVANGQQSTSRHTVGRGGEENGGAPPMEEDNDQVPMMTDIDGRPIDGLGGFDGLDGDAQDSHMDTDFGPLEMFDSATIEPPSTSQANAEAFEENGRAPAAVMSTDEPSASQVKKHKRDKNKKKKNKGDDAAAEPHEEEHHRREKRNATLDTSDASPSTEDAPGSQDLGGKRKRRSSDANGEKRRKKRKSFDNAPEDSVEGATEEKATGFLRKNSNSGMAPVAAMAEGDAAESDPQRSPSVARLRRRSQSREARSREPSTSPEVAQDEVENSGVKRDHGALAALDVEGLAREAWYEHINGQTAQALDSAQSENAGGADVEMGDAPQSAENGAVAENQETTTPRPKRTSTRKKSKPTFFDQPQEVQDGANLPSPSAMTPKPRRAKPATKKAPKPKAPKPPANEDYEEDPDAPKGRRNRMAGFTKGRFTDEELERITRQVKAFAEENQLDQFQVNEMIQAHGGTTAGEAHAQLWDRLFAECPDRHRQKVINITRKKFHNFVARGTWTPEQDAELRHFIGIHGQQWSKIAGIVNRHPEDIRDRYRNYIICGDNQRKDAWTEEEEQRLAKYIIEAMTSIDELRAMQPDRKMLQGSYEELIDWQNISERMDRTRSRLQCITKWKAMNFKTHGKDQLASLQPDSQISFHLDKARHQIKDMPATERYRLLLALRDCKASSDATIPWARLLDKGYRAQWHRATLGLLWHRLKKTIPGYQDKSIRDSAQQLIDEYDHKGELPDVDGDDYSDAEEMQIIQATAVPVRTGKEAERKAKSKKYTRSEDYVLNSDDEGDAAVEGPAEGEAAEAQSSGLQIDPALMAEQHAEVGAEAAEEPAQESETSKKTASKKTPEKKTPAKKTASSRKRPSTKKGMLSQDPIEDDDPPKEEEKPRKKKAAGKSKASGGRGKKREASPLPPPAESSDMEDMEDVPARIPA